MGKEFPSIDKAGKHYEEVPNDPYLVRRRLETRIKELEDERDKWKQRAEDLVKELGKCKRHDDLCDQCTADLNSLTNQNQDRE